MHQAVYDDFLSRLLDRVKNVRQGPAEEPGNFMGPVISADAQEKINGYVALGKREGRLISGAARPSENGYFVSPAVFDRLPKNSRLWTEEIFGPVLAVEKVRSFEEALRRTNATDYGLTGAVYSRNEENLESARAHFFCGNLYFNRKCTGAQVGGHPFGGFNMSGTDSKAGGPDYLLLFTQAKCISERPCS